MNFAFFRNRKIVENIFGLFEVRHLPPWNLILCIAFSHTNYLRVVRWLSQTHNL